MFLAVDPVFGDAASPDAVGWRRGPRPRSRLPFVSVGQVFAGHVGEPLRGVPGTQRYGLPDEGDSGLVGASPQPAEAFIHACVRSMPPFRADRSRAERPRLPADKGTTPV